MRNNKTTLGKDIRLDETSNGYWDITFQNGDTIIATENESVRNALIISCLTSWNYLNRKGNKTYNEFGNRAYQELKKKKGPMREYLIKQYFIEVLNRIRRVHRIVDIQVLDHPTDPNAYNVKFTVETINDEMVSGEFPIGNTIGKSTSYLTTELYTPYGSNKKPLEAHTYLRNEFGGGIQDEILIMHISENNGNHTTEKAIGKTDHQGHILTYYTPTLQSNDNTISFTFQGNTTYEPCESETLTFKTEQYDYILQFLNTNDEPIILMTADDEYITIKIQLLKHYLLTNQHQPIANTELLIKDSKGKTEKATLDEEGKAEITIKNTYKELTLKTQYEDKTATCTITNSRTTPILHLNKTIGRVVNGYTQYIYKAWITDENNNTITEHIDDLTITFYNENNEQLGTFPVNSQLGSAFINFQNITIWSATLNGNNYYNSVTETYTE